MRSTAMGTPSLPDMPPEFLLDVQSRLTYGSRVALRLACHELHRKIDDPTNASTSLTTEMEALSKILKGVTA